MMRAAAVLACTALLFAPAGAGAADRDPLADPAPEAPGDEAEATLEVEGFTAHVTDADGHLTHRLQGTRLREYGRDGVQFIDDPVLDLLDTDGPDWNWQAPHAVHQPEREVLHTVGPTRGVRPEHEDRVRTVIESSDVRVALDTRLTTSPAFTTLERPGLFQRGTGLRADPQADTMELLAEVYSVYSDLPQEDRAE